MTSLETAQLKLECLKIAERTSPLKVLENAKAYYEWVMLSREEKTPKVYVDRGNSNLIPETPRLPKDPRIAPL